MKDGAFDVGQLEYPDLRAIEVLGLGEMSHPTNRALPLESSQDVASAVSVPELCSRILASQVRFSESLPRTRVLSPGRVPTADHLVRPRRRSRLHGWALCRESPARGNPCQTGSRY